MRRLIHYHVSLHVSLIAPALPCKPDSEFYLAVAAIVVWKIPFSVGIFPLRRRREGHGKVESVFPRGSRMAEDPEAILEITRGT